MKHALHRLKKKKKVSELELPFYLLKTL